jgi:hypothetical protein
VFGGLVFAGYVGEGVLFKRNTGIASLLRTVMDKAVFTNIEVNGRRRGTSSRWAFPAPDFPETS